MIEVADPLGLVVVGVVEAGVELDADDGVLLVELAMYTELDCVVATDAADVMDVEVERTELVATLDAVVNGAMGMVPL